MTTLQISDMHCGACVRRVTAALRDLPGTRVESVEIGTARVETTADAATLEAAIGRAGFSARVQAA